MDAELRDRLREVAGLFLRLGVLAFGGPAAHIAMMRREVVVARRWMSDSEFLDMVGATSLIPGPNSTEMAMHLGSRRAGWRGLAVAGTLFILPAAAIVTALAYAYVRLGTTPAVDWVLYGVKPVVIAIVAGALWGLGRAALRTPISLLPAAGGAALYLLGANEVFVVLGSGALGAGEWWVRRAAAGGGTALSAVPWLPLAGAAGLGAQAAAAPYGAAALFLTFLKIGSVLYGSGYVLLAFLRGDFVERLGWITEQQLLDAVAVGQVTPGPVFTTATFIGYVVGGLPGAVLATVAIFLPSFVFVALLSRLLPLVEHSGAARSALDWINAASLGLMAAVAYQLARASIFDPFTLAALAVAAAVVLGTRINAAWPVLAGGVAGALYRLAAAGW